MRIHAPVSSLRERAGACPVLDTGERVKSLHTPSPLGYSIAMPANTTKLTSIVEVIFSDTMFDIYLNDRAYWRNVPANVWGYKLGGYQVLKKWLSYRRARFWGGC